MDWTDISVIVGVAVVTIILAMAALVLWKMLINRIPLDSLLMGSDGTASLARFQFLLFTFVIAGIYLVLCIESGTLLEVPETVLGLLGISGGSYVISKGLTENRVKEVQVTEITGVNPGAPAPAPPPAGGAAGGGGAASLQMRAAQKQDQAADKQLRAGEDGG